jgi:hypothetical protein
VTYTVGSDVIGAGVGSGDGAGVGSLCLEIEQMVDKPSSNIRRVIFERQYAQKQ